MKRAWASIGALAVLVGVPLLAGPAAAKKCKGDAVQVGSVCVDKYEASVWEIPAANTALIKKVQKSRIGAAADLSGATQRGLSSDDYPPACPDTANGCKDDYAVSIAGVQPSVYINWFQAVAACRNAGKRLATNLEWQMAALGTPDPGTDNGTTDCNIASTGRVNTGSRNLCVSDVSAFDMVGNVAEWVADWGAVSQCGNWDDAHGDDLSCVGSSSSTGPPSALYRGGSWGWGVNAGVFAVVGADQPDESFQDLGFRCAREL